MGVFNRFLLFIYALFIALLSIGIILIVFQFVPSHILQNEFQFLTSRWETGAGAFVVFLISIHLLLCCFDSKSDKVRNDKEILVVHGENGDINIATEALRDLIQRMTSNVRGVREVKVSCGVVSGEAGTEHIKADIRLVIGQERGTASISDEIRSRIDEELLKLVGSNDHEVAVSVTSITSGVTTKKRHLV